MQDENKFKKDFGNKLASVRKEKSVTQQQLAESINYSDKAVSKWERGESVPDICTACDICDTLGTSLDYLCGLETINSGNINSEKAESRKNRKKVISVFVPAISVAGVFFICSVLYFVLKNIALTTDYAALSFGLAVPVTFIVLLVLSFIWWRSRLQFVCLSGLIWSVGVFTYVIIERFLSLRFSSYIFISCAILQITAILVFVFVYALKKSKIKDK